VQTRKSTDFLHRTIHSETLLRIKIKNSLIHISDRWEIKREESIDEEIKFNNLLHITYNSIAINTLKVIVNVKI